MNDDLYRSVFSAKLKYYMNKNGKNQTDLMRDLHLSSSTVSSWCTGQKLPRMGKIQMLADYFGINKSDLIEEDSPEDPDGAALDFINGIDPFVLSMAGDLFHGRVIQDMLDQNAPDKARAYLLNLFAEQNGIQISDTDPQIDRILAHAKELNANGLAKLGDYAEDLSENPKYQKKKPSEEG